MRATCASVNLSLTIKYDNLAYLISEADDEYISQSPKFTSHPPRHALLQCALPAHWQSPNFKSHPPHPIALAYGPIPASADRLLDMFAFGSADRNSERALIIHPTMSNHARATRASANIPLPEDDDYDLQYPMSEDEADDEYSPNSPIFKSPSATPYNSPTPSLFDRDCDAHSNYAAYGADSCYDSGEVRSMSPLDFGVSAGQGTNYIYGDTREIIDLTYDSDGDSLMTDE